MVDPSHTYALRHYFWKPETPFNIQVGLRGLYVRQERYTYDASDIHGAISHSYTKGETLGYTNGYNQGESDGYNSGYDVGHEVGYNEGWALGEASGYDEGYEDGGEYSEAEIERLESDNATLRKDNASLQGYKDSNNALSSLSEGIFKGLSSFLEPIFNFEFLGVKVSTAIGLLGTTVVAFIVLKLIRG